MVELTLSIHPKKHSETVKHSEKGHSLNAVEREPVPTRVFNVKEERIFRFLFFEIWSFDHFDTP